MTTEQQYSFTSSRSIPSNYYIPINTVVYNKETTNFSISDNVNLVDGSTSNLYTNLVNFNGHTRDYLVGFRVGFSPTIDGGFYSEHTIDISRFEMQFRTLFNDVNRTFYLSSYSVPTVAYAVYNGVYDYQIYDGSVNYDRWVYDNSFTIRKPISVSLSSSDFRDTGAFRGNLTISAPSLSVSDLLDVTAYRNNIMSGTSFNEKQVEDYSYQNVRISCDTVTIFVLYELDSTNFYIQDNDNPNIPYSSDSMSIRTFVRANAEEPSIVNVRSVDYLDNSMMSLKNISNGLSLMLSTLSSSLGDVVSNATDNANRIIQNTTQKVDEVKQGVTEVKDSVVETKNSILDLPNKIKEMLIGLVVPDDETINAKYAEFDELLASRFGLIYQSADIIHDFAESFQTQAVMTADTGGIITMPSVTVNLAGTLFTFGGYDVDIIPDGFEFLQQALRLAISMVCTVVFVNMCKNKLEAILK